MNRSVYSTGVSGGSTVTSTTQTTTTTAVGGSSTTYNIVDTYVGNSFLTGWQHQAIGDPTNGRVKCV